MFSQNSDFLCMLICSSCSFLKKRDIAWCDIAFPSSRLSLLKDVLKEFLKSYILAQMFSKRTFLCKMTNYRGSFTCWSLTTRFASGNWSQSSESRASSSLFSMLSLPSVPQERPEVYVQSTCANNQIYKLKPVLMGHNHAHEINMSYRFQRKQT